MNQTLWVAILSSSVISGVLVALLAGWFSLRAKRNDYINDYYKLVLNRRIQAYEQVEFLIATIKAAVLDDDKRPYHILFSKDDDHEAVYKILLDVMSESLWLSDELLDRARELNVLIFSRGGDKNGLIEFGKQNYQAIAELRTKIEKLHARDMLVLHKVPRFLKNKKPRDSYVSISLTGRGDR